MGNNGVEAFPCLDAVFPYKELTVRPFQSRFGVYPSPCIVTRVWIMAETKNKQAVESLMKWRLSFPRNGASIPPPAPSDVLDKQWLLSRKISYAFELYYCSEPDSSSAAQTAFALRRFITVVTGTRHGPLSKSS